jgi:hypothetical protein
LGIVRATIRHWPNGSGSNGTVEGGATVLGFGLYPGGCLRGEVAWYKLCVMVKRGTDMTNCLRISAPFYRACCSIQSSMLVETRTRWLMLWHKWLLVSLWTMHVWIEEYPSTIQYLVIADLGSSIWLMELSLSKKKEKDIML